jgi:hypothetical protein
VLGLLLLTLCAPLGAARELRRQMPFVRALLMGDAYVAVADEASALFYNPAGLARVQDNSVEAFSLQFASDVELSRLLLDPTGVQSQYAGLTPAELAGRIGTGLHYDTSLRIPFIVSPGQGSAFGIGMESMGTATIVDAGGGVPALELESFVDQTLVWTVYGRTGHLALGMTLKVISRAGVDKTIDAATLYAGGSLDLANDPDYQNLAAGQAHTRGGIDLGLVYEFPGAPNWQPRLGLAILNLGGKRGAHYTGIEFSDPPDDVTPPVYGEFPLNIVAGFALSPTFNEVRYTFALDLVDIGKTALDGDSLNVRTRLGAAMEFGPHEDGSAMFSLLMGWNATHFGVGILSRVSVFEIGFGRYKIEKGEEPGAMPEHRRVLIFAIRV